jgi:hypothetical protein
MHERHIHPTADELQHQQAYTLHEAADALLIGINIVRHAVLTGELPALMAGHDVVAIRREDIVTWFQERERTIHHM